MHDIFRMYDHYGDELVITTYTVMLFDVISELKTKDIYLLLSISAYTSITAMHLACNITHNVLEHDSYINFESGFRS